MIYPVEHGGWRQAQGRLELGGAPGAPCPENPTAAPSSIALQRQSNSPLMSLSSEVCNATALSSSLIVIQTMYHIPRGCSEPTD